MQRLVRAYSPDDSPVKVMSVECRYQAQKEGVYASIEFTVGRKPAVEEGSEEVGSGRSGTPGVLEAVEFTFAFLDLFDNFLGSMQGLAGPGRYPSGRKRYRARWVFDLEGAFSQYHALCFPSQARWSDGEIWRCDRGECLKWLNEQVEDSSFTFKPDDVFPDGLLREGTSD